MPSFSHEIPILVGFLIKHLSYPGAFLFWGMVED
jgi:hypothetical protein